MWQTLLALFIGGLVGAWIHALRARAIGAQPAMGGVPTGGTPAEDPPTVEELADASPSEVRTRLESALQQQIQPLEHPEEFVELPFFAEACRCLDPQRFPDRELTEWTLVSSTQVSILAAAVLLERDAEKGEHQILAVISNFSAWGRYILLRLLDRVHPPDEPWVLRLLLRLDETWYTDFELRVLREWITRREQDEEPPPDDELREWLASLPPQQLAGLAQTLTVVGPEVGLPWRAAVQRAAPAPTSADSSSGLPFDPTGGDPLTECGRLWSADETEALDLGVEYRARDEVARRTSHLLRRRSPAPLVVVGPSRSGKSTLVRAVMKDLLDEGWRVLEATPDQVNAGMAMVGQLESRVDRLARAIRPGEKVLWSVPDVVGLAWSGSVTGDRGRTIGRILRRSLEQREVVVLGECSRAEWERARVLAPWLTTCFEVVETPVPDERTTRDLVARWLEDREAESGTALVDPPLQREAWELTRQFLSESQRPGNLFDTMRLALEERSHDEPEAEERPLTREDLLRSVARRTGLPLDLLDDRQALDVDAVRHYFREHVRGQEEAVECLVDRLAMVKAGVTDPTRPLGVFLFAGPTGSGKTEIAKTLASWLFGSTSRMVRLDMSELRTPDSLDKLLGSHDPTADVGGSLVERIRREPFSVVLLDEFEKAATEVWDLFLQVFDDGRLGDRRGRVADFRHSVILLTSNLGSRVETRAGVGFRAEAAGFRPSRVQEALDSTFRPEFLNRLDRVVVFRPLSRETMREILVRQIEQVTQRRGLRERPWAMELDESALELLLAQGFSLDLGARPLKRALEHHLLAPLARTMARQQTPEGDQFLFVRREGDALAIDFVDPDSPGIERPPAVEDPATTDGSASLTAIALEPHGLAAELETIDRSLSELEERIESESWKRKRQAELEMTSLEDFWQDEDRFVVLDQFQARERIERVVRSSRSLLHRLRRPDREMAPRRPVRQLARRLILLRAAVEDLEEGRPGEVLILVHDRSHGHDTAMAQTHVTELAGMYRSWAKDRGASLRELGVPSGNSGPSWAATVQGFGVVSLLEPESGLHVFEAPDDPDHRRTRASVRAHVVPLEPCEPERDLGRERLHQLLRDPDDLTSVGVVRRYRHEPSPLVRDGVRGYRTGRIDRVLAGEFDLFAGDPETRPA